MAKARRKSTSKPLRPDLGCRRSAATNVGGDVTLIAEPGSYTIIDRPAFTIRPARSSRKRKNQGGGEQTRRARVVLKRMFGGREGYPTRDELAPVDLYDRFAKEYEKVEGKANPPSKLGMPSREVVMREVGYKHS